MEIIALPRPTRDPRAYLERLAQHSWRPSLVDDPHSEDFFKEYGPWNFHNMCATHGPAFSEIIFASSCHRFSVHARQPTNIFQEYVLYIDSTFVVDTEFCSIDLSKEQKEDILTLCKMHQSALRVVEQLLQTVHQAKKQRAHRALELKKADIKKRQFRRQIDEEDERRTRLMHGLEHERLQRDRVAAVLDQKLVEKNRLLRQLALIASKDCSAAGGDPETGSWNDGEFGVFSVSK